MSVIGSERLFGGAGRSHQGRRGNLILSDNLKQARHSQRRAHAAPGGMPSVLESDHPESVDVSFPPVHHVPHATVCSRTFLKTSSSMFSSTSVFRMS